MKFKQWILETTLHGIVIQTNQGDAQLATAADTANNFTEFNYQDDNFYSRWSIYPQKANIVGYANIGSRSSHVVITKHDPFEGGADTAFAENLTRGLRASNFKLIPWKEGDSKWISTINKETDSAIKQKSFDFNTDLNPRDKPINVVNFGSLNVSKTSGSWTVVIESFDAGSTVRSVINLMKKAIQPLLDNDFVDFYEVVSRATGKRDIVYSKSGQTSHDEYRNEFTKYLEQTLYMADVLLKNYPLSAATVKANVDRWKLPNLIPRNHNIPVATLFNKVDAHNANDVMLHFFFYLAQKQDTKLFNMFEEINKLEKDNTSKYKSVSGPLFHEALILLNADLGKSQNSTNPLELPAKEFWKNIEDPNNLKRHSYLQGTVAHILENEAFWSKWGFQRDIDRIQAIVTKTIIEIFQERPDLSYGLAKIATHLPHLPEEIKSILADYLEKEDTRSNKIMKRRNLMHSMGKDFLDGKITPQKAKGLIKKHLGADVKLPAKGETLKLNNDFELKNVDGVYYVDII